MIVTWKALFWLIHILGLTLWLGSSLSALLIWPHPQSQEKKQNVIAIVHTLRSLVARGSFFGGLLVAISGTSLSLILQPKSELASLWLTTMQGLGVIAFILAFFVLPRVERTIFVQESPPRNEFDRAQKKYRNLVRIIVLLLLLCLLMAAFKPQ